MRILALLSLISATQAFGAIIVPDSAVPYRNDSYFLQQWGLVNQAQIVVHDLDDIHSAQTVSRPGIDIDWLASITDIEAKLNRDVVVAVLDYGIDLSHKDLENSVAVNTAECPDGKLPPLGSTADNDKNGYPGDCKGWNFATQDPKGNNRPEDDFGHGTHVSGILAATGNNSLGVTGMSSKIKILPVKVLSTDEASLTVPVTERVAKGIEYAIARHVDVINLSLGFPRVFNTDHVKAAIQKAVKQGIWFVAAAGNNGNPAAVEPCSYEGVICVGAVSNDGNLAPFSNYGGNVDILAPGDTILSTTPTYLGSQYFSVAGYDYKDGTSQAAPYVSGTLALLVGAYPDASPSEIKARLFESTAPAAFSTPREHASLSGLVQLSSAFKIQPRTAIYPVWKGVDEIEVDPANLSFEIPLGYENLWLPARSIHVRAMVTSAEGSKDVLGKFVQSIPTMKAAETRRFTLRGQLKSADADSRAILTMTITATGSDGKKISRDYQREVQWILKDDPSRWIRRPIISDSTVAVMQGATVSPKIESLDDPFNLNSEPEYKLVEPIKTGGSTLHLFQTGEGQVRELGKTYSRADAGRTLNLLRIASQNPAIKYLWSFAVANTHMDYCFLNENAEPVGSCIQFTPETIIPPQTSVWTDTTVQQQTVPTAVFVGRAMLPDSCKNPDPFAPRDNGVKSRLFYLEPEAKGSDLIYKTRCILATDLATSLKPTMTLNWDETVVPLATLASSAEERAQGIVRVLVSAGNGNRTRNFILVLDHLKISKFIPLDGEGVPLDLTTPAAFTNLGDPTLVGSSLGLDSLGESIRASVIDNAGHVQTEYVSRPPGGDSFLAIDAVYAGSRYMDAVVETKQKLEIYRRDRKTGELSSFERPIIRFSFLSGDAVNQTQFPVTFTSATGLIPALFINGSLISSKAVNVLEVQDGGVVQPVSFQLKIPQNCAPMNPVYSAEVQAMSLVLLCQTPNSNAWELRYLGLR